MVVFTFVNHGHAGGYFISSGRAAMGWLGLPYDLDRQMEDVRRKGEEVEDVSIGLDGDWFLRTNARHACKTEHESADLVSNVGQFVQLLEQAGLSLADYAIQFFTFVPDPTGYVTVLHKTDGSLTRCAWHNVPSELDAVLEREGPKGVRHVTVGVNGAYVVTLNSGVVLWGAGVPGRLQQLLEDAARRRRSVETVSLSLVTPGWYFVRFADGAADFSLPPDWHQSVSHYSTQAVQTSRAPTMATSSYTGNHNHGAPFRAQTYPQYAPQQPLAQFGSYNPGGPARPPYGGGPDPGYKPFQSNPYAPSGSTGMPQQPAYSVANIYNNPIPQQPQQQQREQHQPTSSLAIYNDSIPQQPQQQQQEQHQPTSSLAIYNNPIPQQPQQQQQGQHQPTSSLAKYDGLFTLLGGALKLAGTVLKPVIKNALQNEWNSFTDDN